MPTADAAVTNIPNEVLGILTADCLPVLFASMDGRVVGVAHAGWRGLCQGVLENTVAAILSLTPDLDASHISVWLGPAIGPTQFEVGEDVLDAFHKQPQPIPPNAFMPIQNRPGKYLANLYSLAKSRLNKSGIECISGGELCTYSDPKRFFSYRRDGETGRFASLIWIS
jgi:YfiH family protein